MNNLEIKKNSEGKFKVTPYPRKDCGNHITLVRHLETSRYEQAIGIYTAMLDEDKHDGFLVLQVSK